MNTRVEQSIDNATHGEFDYICDKITAATFDPHPFRHLVIESFLSEEHFTLITSCRQIALPVQPSTEALIKTLLRNGYKVQAFPGCTTDIADYIKRLKKNDWPIDKVKLEGYGMAFRLVEGRDQTIARLISFLNGPAFKSALEKKFGITRENRIETAIQKYLSGYEISPHPDVRSKCLTYLLNINTSEEASGLPIHTHLLKFKPEREFIYSFWENNPEFNRCWVPWDWCTSVKTISMNNAFVVFQAHDRSLHAIKLRYDHTKFQRTQIFGNLWHTDVPIGGQLAAEYEEFDIGGKRCPASSQPCRDLSRESAPSGSSMRSLN